MPEDFLVKICEENGIRQDFKNVCILGQFPLTTNLLLVMCLYSQ